MCDYHGMPYRDEVSWDVDTIYLSHDTRELSLRDFDHLDQKDLVPIISALEYNTWFTKLRASGMKLTHESLERILHVMKKSLSIEELYLDNLAVKWEFAHKLSLALIANNNTPLHTLDLSHNLIEDKGASSLCGIIAKIMQGANHLSNPLARVPKGLVHLSLGHCGLSSKGVNQLAHALSLNKFMPNSLTYLNLSGNNLRDDINNLCNFLAQPNTITYLDISGTDIALETIFGALLRGCATNMVHLNVSRNAFSTKKTKEVPPSFKQFFTSTLSLKKLIMAYCKLPLEALKNLLLGLACNESTTDMELDMSYNNLGAQGAHVLESCIHGIRCIGTLDISDNNMDVELASVVTAISKNKSIKHLSMGRNLNNMKAKHVSSVMDALVQMIQQPIRQKYVLSTNLSSVYTKRDDQSATYKQVGVRAREGMPLHAATENRSCRRQTSCADSTIVGIADRSYSPTTSRTGLLREGKREGENGVEEGRQAALRRDSGCDSKSYKNIGEPSRRLNRKLHWSSCCLTLFMGGASITS
uniref:Uncharacterized protein n=1 Tax=Timema monikensis TaxID=170555 RepID=A0A7R9HTB0_9NEOP|nr:unnamed protein product [Timema monikensis]